MKARSLVTTITELRSWQRSLDMVADAAERLYAVSGDKWITLGPGAMVRVSDLRAVAGVRNKLRAEIARRRQGEE